MLSFITQEVIKHLTQEENMENITLPPDTAEKIEKDLAVIIKESKSISITNEEENRNAAEFLVKIKSRKKRLEELRTSITKPINDALKATNNRFKMFTEPLDEAEHQVKWAIGAYADQKERIAQEIAAAEEKKRQAEAERLAKEVEFQRQEAERAMAMAKTQEEAHRAEEMVKEVFAKEAEAEAALAPIEAPAPQTFVRTESGMVHTKKVWTFDIINELEVPRQYLIVDVTAIRRAISGGEREIKGVKIYQETQVATR